MMHMQGRAMLQAAAGRPTCRAAQYVVDSPQLKLLMHAQGTPASLAAAQARGTVSETTRSARVALSQPTCRHSALVECSRARGLLLRP